MSAINELLARVKAATGPDDAIDYDLVKMFVSDDEARIHKDYHLNGYCYTHTPLTPHWRWWGCCCRGHSPPMSVSSSPTWCLRAGTNQQWLLLSPTRLIPLKPRPPL